MSYLVPKDIPNCCAHCPYNYSSLICKITKSEIDRDDEYRERLEDCPLIEVKTPHGRLIDADKIDYRNDAMHDGTGHLVVADNFMNGVLWINDCIDNAPTVIEAED